MKTRISETGGGGYCVNWKKRKRNEVGEKAKSRERGFGKEWGGKGTQLEDR